MSDTEDSRDIKKMTDDGFIYQLRKIGPEASCSKVPEMMRLNLGLTKIGRGQHNDYFLDSAVLKNFISRSHVEITGQKNENGEIEFVMTDKGLNGTFVNDVRTQKSCILEINDKITFGHTNGYKIEPGSHAEQPKSEFQFIFEKIPIGSKTTEVCEDLIHEDSPESPVDLKKDLGNDRTFLSDLQSNNHVQKSSKSITSQKNRKRKDSDSMSDSDKIIDSKPKGSKKSGKSDIVSKGSSKKEEPASKRKTSSVTPSKFSETLPAVRDDDEDDEDEEIDDDDNDKDDDMEKDSKSEDQSDSASESEDEVIPKKKRKSVSESEEEVIPKKKRKSASESEDEVIPKKKRKSASESEDEVIPKKKQKSASESEDEVIPKKKRKIPLRKTAPQSTQRKVVQRGKRSVPKESSSSESNESSDNESSKPEADQKPKQPQTTSRQKVTIAAPPPPPPPPPSKFKKRATSKDPPTVGRKRKQRTMSSTKSSTSVSSEVGENLEPGVEWYDEDKCDSAECKRPKKKKTPWVQCDDCDGWYHTICVGANYKQLKDSDARFNCGCES